MEFSVYFASEDFWLTNLQFITFTPHHLDQNCELEFSAAHHLERVGAPCFLDLDGDIGEKLFIQSIAQVTGRYKLPFPPGEWRIVNSERHRNRGLVDLDFRKSFWALGTRDGFTDSDTFYAGDCENISNVPDRLVDTL